MSIFAHVTIEADLSLSDVASVTSRQLLGGVPLIVDSDGVRDECPAMVSRETVLGLGLTLYGDGGSYGLDLEQWIDEEEPAEGTNINLSKYIASLLENLPGISVMADC